MNISGPRKLKIIIIGMVCFVLIGLAINFTISQSQTIFPNKPLVNIIPTSTRPAQCVPLPSVDVNSLKITSSPTPIRPNPSEAPSKKSTPQQSLGFSPTTTPFAISHIYDLNPQLDSRDKSYVYIYRCNGTMDLFLLGPNDNLSTSIVLGYGDVIYSAIQPASLMGHHPPIPTYLPAQTTISPAAPNSSPYPAPATSTVIPTATPTIGPPYPGPSTATMQP